MLETLKQVAECLTDYIKLGKAIIQALIAVIAFLKKLCVRTIYVRALHFFENAFLVTDATIIRVFKKIQIV